MTGKYSGLRTLTFLLLLNLFASSILSAQDTIKIGVLANRGEAESQHAWQETTDYLSRELSNYIFELIPLSFSEMEAAVSQSEIDFLVCNPANYILYRERYGLSAVTTLQKAYKDKAYNSYGSVFFTRKDNHSIIHLTDLKGKKVAAMDRLSMGGCLLPSELLQTQGLNLLEDAKTLICTRNHDEIVYSVLSGNVDIGIVRTGIIEEMVDEGDIKLDDIKVIHAQTYTDFPFFVSTDLIPEWPLAKLAHFPNDIALEIVRELFDLHDHSPQDKSISNYGWTIPADYTLVSDKLKNIQAPPFENFEMSLKDKVSKDWYFFILLLGLTISLTLLTIFIRFLQNQLNKKGINKDAQNILKQRFKASSSPFFSETKSFAAVCAQKKYEIKEFWSINYLKWFLVVALGYFLSVEFGLLFSIENSGNTAIWYASGIGFMAVYALGYRIWPAIFLGAFIVNIIAVDIYEIRLFGLDQLYLGIINSSINTLEAILGVYLIRRIFDKTPLFLTIRSTVSFIILIAFFVSLLAAVFGTIAFTTIGNHGHFYGMLLTWWFGDAAGLLLIVPLVLSWKKPELSSSKIKQVGLLIVFSIFLIVVGLFIFQSGYHLAYLFLPFFIYFTFRLGRFMSLIMAFILGLVSIWVVVYLNIYWLWETPVEGLFYVRLFIIILLLTILLVASVLEEQYLAEERMVLYKKIVQHSNDAIAIIDNKGYYLEQNPTHEKLVGYSDVELDGRTPEIHLGLDAFNTIASDLSEKKKSVGEWVSHTKQGDKLIDISFFSVLNDENEVICHVGIKRDITERKKTETRLRESEAEAWSLFTDSAIPVMIEDFSEIKVYIDKLKAVGLTDWEAYFNQNPEEVYRLVPLIKIIDVNKKMIDFYGEGSKEKLFDNLKHFFFEESFKVFQQEIIALASGKYTFTSEIPIRGLKGEILNLFVSVSVPPQYRDTLERVIVSFVDITEIKRAEKTQQILLNISNAANISNDFKETFSAVNTQLGSIIDTSNFFLALYDKEKDELTLPFVQDENDLPKKLPAAKTLTSIVIQDKKPHLLYQKEMEKMDALGKTKTVGAMAKVWLGVPLKVKGEVIGAFVVQSYNNQNAYTERDKETLEIIANQIALSIERKKAEEDVLFALEKAQESDNIKSAFLASMSHELRTPLNAIIGFSNLIDKEMPLEQAIEFAEMIYKSGSNLLQIVDSIFEVSLLDEGVQKVVYGEHSLENLMNDVYQTILTRQKVLNKTEVIITMSHKAPIQHEVYSDDTKLKHIFLHLLNNALKFTNRGSIEFGLDKVDDEKQFHFFVSDTGIGIPKEKQAFIFDRFRMGDDTHNRQHEGMGIGLFICKKLIEMLGGRIELDSDENIGSSFTFYLPLQTKKHIV